MAMHEWEKVTDGEEMCGEILKTYRMEVPGGWLYRIWQSIVFVPFLPRGVINGN